MSSSTTLIICVLLVNLASLLFVDVFLALHMTWMHCEVYWDLDFEPFETSGGQ